MASSANTQPTATEIMAVMDRICAQQVAELFMISAFYVDAALVPVIAPHLDEIDPPMGPDVDIGAYQSPVGAIGRYRTCPVFPKDPTHDADLARRAEEFVEYTFIPLLAAD
jgi:hypothetical protein